MKFLKRMAAFCAAAMLTGSAALAQEYDAQQAKSWMEQFAQALSQLAPVNDPAQTLDPARPGEYLQEYEFGTVQAATSGKPTAAQIEEIDVSTAQVTDARGIRVGMTLNEALNGLSIPLDGVVVVSTPQDLVGMIVRKAVNMANMMNIPVLGLVENMSYALCPDCGKRIELFGKSKIAQEAAALHLPVLAQLPFDPKAAQLCDEGNIEAVENPLMADAARAVAGQVGL